MPMLRRANVSRSTLDILFVGNGTCMAKIRNSTLMCVSRPSHNKGRFRVHQDHPSDTWSNVMLNPRSVTQECSGTSHISYPTGV